MGLSVALEKMTYDKFLNSKISCHCLFKLGSTQKTCPTLLFERMTYITWERKDISSMKCGIRRKEPEKDLEVHGNESLEGLDP
jgi:hypothetical protein